MHCSSLLLLAFSALALAAPTYKHDQGGLLNLDLDADVNTGKVTHLVGGLLHKTGKVVDSVGDAVKHEVESKKGWKKPLLDVDANVDAWLKERSYEHKNGGLLDLDADVDVNAGGLVHGVKDVLGGVLHKTGNVVDSVGEAVKHEAEKSKQGWKKPLLDVDADVGAWLKERSYAQAPAHKQGGLLDLDADVDVNTGGLVYGVEDLVGGVLHKTGKLVKEVGEGVKDNGQSKGSLIDLDADVIVESGKWAKWDDKPASGHH